MPVISVLAMRTIARAREFQTGPVSRHRKAGDRDPYRKEGFMSKPAVKKVPTGDDRSLPIFAEFDKVADRIRERAYRLFTERGFEGGHALDDWLAAEHEVCWPAAELVEEDDEYEIKVALAGYDADEISVTATPEAIIVKADHESEDEDAVTRFCEFHDNRVYRRFGFPAGVRLGDVKAKYENGLLKIEAEKLAEPWTGPEHIDITKAA